MKQPSIKTFFFDLGNVLINFNDDLMWENLSKVCNDNVCNIKAVIYDKNLWKLYEKGLISIQQFISEIEKGLEKKISHDEFIKNASEIFHSNEEMLKLLKSLHKQNYELFLISNTCDIHIDYIKKTFDVLDFFHEKLLSYEVKLAKPDKEIFKQALTLTESKPDECFYIDDLPEHIESASTLGISCHLFQSTDGLRKRFLEMGINV